AASEAGAALTAPETSAGEEHAPVVAAMPHAEPPPLRFKQTPIRLHPAEQRTVSLLFDPTRIAPGTPVTIVGDPGISVSLWRHDVPQPGTRGWSRVSGRVRARASTQPGARLSVIAEAGGYDAELVVLIVSHRGSGWVREIARKDEDAQIEAEFDPE